MSKPKVVHKGSFDGALWYACGRQHRPKHQRDIAPSKLFWKHVTCKLCLARKGKR